MVLVSGEAVIITLRAERLCVNSFLAFACLIIPEIRKGAKPAKNSAVLKLDSFVSSLEFLDWSSNNTSRNVLSGTP